MQSRAVRALQEITDLSFKGSVSRWQAWYEEEQAWFDGEAGNAFDALRGGSDAEIFAALRSLSKRRLHREEIASGIASLLDHPTPAMRVLACQSLAQLKSPAAVLFLIDALHDGSDEVAEGALGALRALTGLDLPLDATAWERACAPGVASMPPR